MQDIKGFEGIYSISRDGKIWSHRQKKWMMTYLINSGYPAIVLKKDGKKSRLLVHRIVAQTFIKKPLLEVNHKNSIRTDCRVQNLEWLTSKENVWHGIKKNYVGCPRGERTFSAKLTDLKVREIRELAKIYTYKEIASRYSVDSSVISRVVNKQTWAHVI